MSEVSNAQVFNFDTTVYNFGSITAGDTVFYDFNFINGGNQDLIISEVHGNCRCITPITWPRTPIKPNKKGVIKAMFNSAGRSGVQEPFVSIYSNDKEKPNCLLFFKGNVKMPDNSLTSKEIEYTTPQQPTLDAKTSHATINAPHYTKADSLAMCIFSKDFGECIFKYGRELKAMQDMGSVSLRNTKEAFATTKLHFNQVKATLSDSVVKEMKSGMSSLTEQIQYFETKPLTGEKLAKAMLWDSFMKYRLDDLEKFYCQ